jgi:hypothetical protein
MRGTVLPEQVSFQFFKTQLLAKDLVEKVEVANKTTAKVFVRMPTRSAPGELDAPPSHQQPGSAQAIYKFYFNIGWFASLFLVPKNITPLPTGRGLLNFLVLSGFFKAGRSCVLSWVKRPEQR